MARPTEVALSDSQAPFVPGAGHTLAWLGLGLIRCAWVAFALLEVIICLRALPGLSTITRPLNITAFDLGFLGVPFEQRETALLAIRTVFYFFLPLTGLALSAIIFWRRSRDWLAVLVAILLMTWIPVRTGLSSFALNLSLVEWLSEVEALVAMSSLVFALFLFPDGRFAPRWAWSVPLVGVAGVVLQMNASALLPGLAPLLVAVALIAGVASQLYRYLRIAGDVARQQAKWAIIGLCVAVLAEVAFIVVEALRPLARLDVQMSYALFVANRVLMVVTPLSLLLVPLTLSVAILRSRLWDIHLIINRTLVYLALTTLLVAVYGANIILWQRLLRVIIGQEHELAVVVSTLVIAALFHPLRRRVQRFIDQRYYRRAYDAARVLTTFSATMRDEVDLNRLSGDLVSVVRETMQPTHVSIWMCPRPSLGASQEGDHLLTSGAARLGGASAPASTSLALTARGS